MHHCVHFSEENTMGKGMPVPWHSDVSSNPTVNGKNMVPREGARKTTAGKLYRV
jgi:hypothetical protein